ncbi:folate-binding protein [Sphingomonas sp. BT-65]|uniref:CAF17-like 4Fe-4S cluster assembly/insertion protein YgfZ n=1 Tax=Sphingomonas sp. BT-65 TaxID=2989821 RepID=UPI00223655DB|nr:folate-binding protein [Sphingomonas sp. BT-65]MCW4462211.1 folate-binding protein [Sphingomonas sp. BT-65]
MTETSQVRATLLADRALIRISGEDVRGFLQGLVTQDVAVVRPGAPQWAGLLTAQGKALFDFILWDADDAILIDCEADQREALIRRLSIYRLRRPIAIEPVEGGVHWSRDAGAGVVDPRLAELGYRWLGEAAGAAATGWREHRLRLGVTEGAAELGQDKTLWLECNAAELNGVSFAKGCYVGQENTARMNWRAKVNRRLVVAPLGEPGERTRIAYPDLGLMVEHRRVEALGDAIVPAWLGATLAAGEV